MSSHLSWTSYFEAVMLLLVLYYAFVGFRFYSADIRRLLNHSAPPDHAAPGLPDQLVYKETKSPNGGLPEEVSYTYDNYPNDDMLKTDNLIAAVKNCIKSASGKPYDPDALLPQVKKVVKEYASLRTSPHRPAINELVVSECERTGVAGLTEDEVDQWWGD